MGCPDKRRMYISDTLIQHNNHLKIFFRGSYQAFEMRNSKEHTIIYSFTSHKLPQSNPTIIPSLALSLDNLAHQILSIHRVSLLDLQRANLPRVWRADDHFLCQSISTSLTTSILCICRQK